MPTTLNISNEVSFGSVFERPELEKQDITDLSAGSLIRTCSKASANAAFFRSGLNNSKKPDTQSNEVPRMFSISANGIEGASGEEDRKAMSGNFLVMKDGSEAIGEVMEMNTVAYVVMYEGDSTIAYRYDPESNPSAPHLIGLMANRRMPMGNLLRDLVNTTI